MKSFSTLVGACKIGMQPVQAAKAFESLMQHGVISNETTYSVSISAFDCRTTSFRRSPKAALGSACAAAWRAL